MSHSPRNQIYRKTLATAGLVVFGLLPTTRAVAEAPATPPHGRPLPATAAAVATDTSRHDSHTQERAGTTNAYSSPSRRALALQQRGTSSSEYTVVSGFAADPDGKGYWLVDTIGVVYAHGSATWWGYGGSAAGLPMVGIAATPGGGGYWTVDAGGGVYSFGDAGSYGSTGGKLLNEPIVGMAATPDGRGYWLAATDGGIFSFGDARFHGSTGNIHLNQPIVGMASTPDGKGYWLVASDGGIFAFGDARFQGSTGAIHLNKPIVGMATSPDGKGYWLVASDGGIFAFGDARFHGSIGNIHLNQPIVAMGATTDGKGYWLVAADGGIFSFGDARFHGTTLLHPAGGAPPAPLPELASHGGPVETHPHVYLVWWGPWPNSVRMLMLVQLRAICSPWSAVLAVYRVACGHYEGSWTDRAPTPSEETTGVVDEALTSALEANPAWPRNVNTQVWVAIYAPYAGLGCDYHDDWPAGSSTAITYIAGASLGACAGSFPGPGMMHEYADAATDPYPGSGWDDSQLAQSDGGGEVADVCLYFDGVLSTDGWVA
jgi:hypothetical protein